MDTRVAPEIRPVRRLPALPLALALGLLLGPAPVQAEPAGSFLGAVNDAPVTIQTDTGAQTTTADLNVVLRVSANSGLTVALRDLDLSTPGVSTGKGDTGTVTGVLKASANAPVTADGHLKLSLAMAVHYPLVDRIFPPSPQPYLESFGGMLSGTFTYDPGFSGYRFEGTLHLSVKGAATEKVLSIDLPLTGVVFQPDSKQARI